MLCTVWVQYSKVSYIGGVSLSHADLKQLTMAAPCVWFVHI